MRYFHGGVPGLRPGDLLLPPDITGTEHTLSRWVPETPGAEHGRRRDVVYLTSVRDVARAFAAMRPDGALYAVQPLDDLDPDPDHNTPGVSWTCSEAVVTSVVDPVVLFRNRSAAAWLRMANKTA